VADLQEIEWQLDAVDLRPVVRWLARFDDPTTAPAPDVRVQPRDAATQIDRYLDTDDWRFQRAGYTLRMRRKGRRHVEFTLKQLDGSEPGPRRRREITEEVGSADPAAIRDAPGDVGTRVRAVAGSHPLLELFEVRTRRRTFAVLAGDAAPAEVALDETTIRPEDGGPPARLRRVEVEVPAEAERAVAPLIETMRSACALQPGSMSKFQLGMLSAGLAGPAPMDLGPVEVDPSASVGEVAFALLRTQFEAFLSEEPGTRLGDDAEALHDMRVASRRLRAATALFRDVLPVRFERLRAELGWVGDALGAVRDLDVQMEELDGWIQEVPEPDRAPLAAVRTVMEEQRSAARADLLGTLDSARYDRLVRGFTQALRTGPLRRAAASRAPVLAAAPDLVERRFRAVRKAGKRIEPTSAATEYHTLRKRARRLRYALESFADVYPGETQGLVKRLVAVQDILGEHQDATVAVERLRALVAQRGRELPPEAVFAMGEIAERYARSMERLRGELPGAYRRLTGRRWRKFRRVMEDRRPPLPPQRALRPVARASSAAGAAPGRTGAPADDPPGAVVQLRRSSPSTGTSGSEA
jgi:CHAD domain-containing protein